MKVNVIRDFKDKTTGILHKIGTEIEVTAARCAEINGTLYGLFVKEVVKKTAKK